MAENETSRAKLDGSIMLYCLRDVCWETDLALLEKKAQGAQRLRIERKRFSKAFEFANPPVTLNLGSMSRELGGIEYRANLYGKFYDFGVLCIIIEIPVSGMTPDDLDALARLIRDDSPFDPDFERLAGGLASSMRTAMKGSGMPGVEEDYAVYYIRPSRGQAEMLRQDEIVSLLLSEEQGADVGEGTRRDLFTNRFSYQDGDLVVVNWDNALVVEPSGSMDIPDLLEFANAQLLELRVYDRMLDKELDAIYERISRRGATSIWKVRKVEALAAKVMRTITELTDITEKVDNSLKVTDDVYYAKVYSATLRLFKVRSWERTIRRKLDIAFRTYDMLYREISTKRSELLELTIIILIAVEIAYFLYVELAK